MTLEQAFQARFGALLDGLHQKHRAQLEGRASAGLESLWRTVHTFQNALAMRRQHRAALAGERRPITPTTWPVDTASPHFRDWFGQSVLVRDERPIPLYHGTVFDFTEFNGVMRERLHGASVHGFYFTSAREVAAQFGDILLTVYLRLERPKRLASGEAAALAYITTQQLEAWRADGHDGVILEDALGDEVAVFDSAQVRVIAREQLP